MGEHAISLLSDNQPGASAMPPTFDELFDSYQEMVLKAAYRVTGNRQDAEDVLQTVFLRLMKNQEQVRISGNPGGYLRRSAVNAGIDLLRSRQRNPTETLVEETLTSDQGAADSLARQTELKRQLREAMLSLDQQAAEIFSLRFFEEFSNAEIAQLLGMTPNSVAVSVHRTRDQLQKIIGEV